MPVYNHKVVEQFLNEYLSTLVNLEGYCETDDSLQREEGDTVTIYRYTLSGVAEEVAEGQGNTGEISIDGMPVNYKVKMAQAKTHVTDEEQARNSFATDAKLQGVGKAIWNKIMGDIRAQWRQSTNYQTIAASGVITFDDLMLGVGKIQGFLDDAENARITLHMNNNGWLNFKRSLASNVLVEYDMINGIRKPIVGGIPVDISSEFADNDIILADKSAVRVVRGKSVGAETSRDADTRTTYYFGRDNYVAALEFSNRVVRFLTAAEQQGDTPATVSVTVTAQPGLVEKMPTCSLGATVVKGSTVHGATLKNNDFEAGSEWSYRVSVNGEVIYDEVDQIKTDTATIPDFVASGDIVITQMS